MRESNVFLIIAHLYIVSAFVYVSANERAEMRRKLRVMRFLAEMENKPKTKKKGSKK